MYLFKIVVLGYLVDKFLDLRGIVFIDQGTYFFWRRSRLSLDSRGCELCEFELIDLGMYDLASLRERRLEMLRSEHRIAA